MALQTEQWVADIVENFFPNNSFVNNSIDHSNYVNDRIVHVSNAGGAIGVEVNQNSFINQQALSREDQDLSYQIDVLYAKPVYVTINEDVENSYDKRASVWGQMKADLQSFATERVLYSWAKDGVQKIATTGKSVPSHIPSATGNRKAFSVADVQAIKRKFDAADVPSEDRYMILDAEMYNQLMEELTDGAKMNFLAGANPETGILGQYLGFSFYMRSKVLKTSAAGAKKEWSANAAATDSAAGLAWQKSCVARAMGETEVFINERDAFYCGDVLRCTMRVGGTAVRSDDKGVVLIYQGAEA